MMQTKSHYRAENQIPIIIPSLHPDQKLITLVTNLREYFGDQHLILIVDDGSREEYSAEFAFLQDQLHCHVLTHAVNLGKGRALKTAFNHLLCLEQSYIGVITTDADGQHALADIKHCMQELREHSNELIFGCRQFDQTHVPLKSRFGNKLTRALLQLLTGITLSDTQTGLRAIPLHYLNLMMTVPGERFEYEMNMILACKEHQIKIKEVPIQTIYLEENRSSHFNPITDSIRIYSIFGKYILASGTSFVIDVGCFYLFSSFLKYVNIQFYIILATILARLISSAFNFYANRQLVFKNGTEASIRRYYSLVILQMMLSAVLVSILYNQFIFIGETLWKVVVDTILFVVSFQVQRSWVFANHTEEA